MNPRKLTAEDLIAYRKATILHNRLVGYPDEKQWEYRNYNEWSEEEIKEFFRKLSEEIHKMNNEKGTRSTGNGYWTRRKLCIFYGHLFFKGWKMDKIERIMWDIAQRYKG